MTKKKQRILVLAGGPSAEHEISRQSGMMVTGALDTTKYQVALCVVDKQRFWKFSNQKKRYQETDALKYIAHRYDIVFLALHGAYGEDGTIQALLSSIDMRYTGSDVGASALAWDKELSNMIAASIGLQVPKWLSITNVDQLQHWRVWPAFLKPVKNGSSIDVSIAKSQIEARQETKRLLQKYSQVMIQQYCHGRELTCGVIEDARGTPQTLPITEIRPKGRAFFDYEAKYTSGLTDEITPAPLSRSVAQRVQRGAIAAHQAFGCHGLSRSDFILVGSTPWYLETNTIPGLTKLSLLPQEANAAGMTFSRLLETIILSAR